MGRAQSAPATQQLQRTAEQSRSAADALTAEDAAHKASQPFDQGSKTVDLRNAKTLVVDPARVRGTAATPPGNEPTTNSMAGNTGGSWAKPAATMNTAPTTSTAPTSSAVVRPNVASNATSSRMGEATSAAAVRDSGILDAHAREICDYVQKECRGTIIMQNVNPGAAKWIAQGNAVPKPMTIKAKSSDRPGIAGLIPCEPEKDAKVVDPQILAAAKESIEKCKECQCVDKSGTKVLADLQGRLYVSDYDPYAISCEGDQGPVTDGRLGVATEAQRKTIDEINRKLTFPIQHGAALEYGESVKLPLTVFEYDAESDRCRISSLTSETQLKEYLRLNGLKEVPMAKAH
jgi:hypothetical protein